MSKHARPLCFRPSVVSPTVFLSASTAPADTPLRQAWPAGFRLVQVRLGRSGLRTPVSLGVVSYLQSISAFGPAGKLEPPHLP
jgi:hypothetical protein